MRPSWDETFLRVCEIMKERGTCQRLQVGAAVVKGCRIISTGYNGAPRSLEHCHHDLYNGHAQDDPHLVGGHCANAEHAESNALMVAGERADGATLYSTVSPCLNCMRLAVTAGIKRIVFAEWFRKTEPSKALAAAAGIQLSHVLIP